MGGGRWREERKKNPLSLYLGAGNSAGGDLPSALELPRKEPASPGGLGSKVPVDVTRRQADHLQKSANGAGFPAPTPGRSVQGLTAAALGVGWGGVWGGVLVPEEPAAFSSPVGVRAKLLTANQRRPLQASRPPGPKAQKVSTVEEA